MAIANPVLDRVLRRRFALFDRLIAARPSATIVAISPAVFGTGNAGIDDSRRRIVPWRLTLL